ncbi:hypothetical protein CEUSTIGMA_g887.t1 [Chlamydomonas eustigma]|uniref:Uncharacterized protein n=1 Tax=Chlamydomonas eustigma TaxID=1157962 RepID=A0A250WRH0_9CHLO|nr:hypothetical protein CEUSTIGMA_g887.t1 [Chlamydomonas eustigma]|eukprot:GAX73435.1 hypothetical protein CEUSTIGMA_g887.t1 [Chlamydomonas eustigma]
MWAGENCRTCPQDCPTYYKSPKPYCCGSSTTQCNDTRCFSRPKGIYCRTICPALGFLPLWPGTEPPGDYYISGPGEIPQY